MRGYAPTHPIPYTPPVIRGRAAGCVRPGRTRDGGMMARVHMHLPRPRTSVRDGQLVRTSSLTHSSPPLNRLLASRDGLYTSWTDTLSNSHVAHRVRPLAGEMYGLRAGYPSRTDSSKRVRSLRTIRPIRLVQAQIATYVSLGLRDVGGRARGVVFCDDGNRCGL